MFFKFNFNWRITALQCHIGHSGGGDSGTKMLFKMISSCGGEKNNYAFLQHLHLPQKMLP